MHLTFFILLFTNSFIFSQMFAKISFVTVQIAVSKRIFRNAVYFELFCYTNTRNFELFLCLRNHQIHFEFR